MKLHKDCNDIKDHPTHEWFNGHFVCDGRVTEKKQVSVYPISFWTSQGYLFISCTTCGDDICPADALTEMPEIAVAANKHYEEKHND